MAGTLDLVHSRWALYHRAAPVSPGEEAGMGTCESVGCMHCNSIGLLCVVCYALYPSKVVGFLFVLFLSHRQGSWGSDNMSCVVSYMEDSRAALWLIHPQSLCFSLLPPLVATHWGHSRTEVGNLSQCALQWVGRIEDTVVTRDWQPDFQGQLCGLLVLGSGNGSLHLLSGRLSSFLPHLKKTLGYAYLNAFLKERFIYVFSWPECFAICVYGHYVCP